MSLLKFQTIINLIILYLIWINFKNNSSFISGGFGSYLDNQIIDNVVVDDASKKDFNGSIKNTYTLYTLLENHLIKCHSEIF